MAKAPKKAKPDFSIKAYGVGSKSASLQFKPSPEFAKLMKAAWENADTSEGERVAYVYDRLAYAIDAWFGNHKTKDSKGVKFTIKRS